MKHFFSLFSFLLLLQPLLAQTNIDLRSFLQFGERASNLWGYTDSLGNEYAIIGLQSSLNIVNVTNPDSAQLLHTVPGPSSTWREVRVWDHYAYATNETGNGLLIVDLAGLPGSVQHRYETFGGQLYTAHTVLIDEQGFGYLFGYNDSLRTIPTDQRGAYIIDLRNDPWNPTFAGKYSNAYVHDGFARNDTLWASQIYAGNLAVVDMSIKASPRVLATQETPSRFTHNNWASNDGTLHVTTDEVSGGYIAFYDVSDLENITETDRYQSSPGAGVIPHNAYFLDNYVVASYYKDGIVILDATKKNNIVEVGRYDTSPFISSDGFNGCWGVYPYFPSGTIIASDIEEGLFVLTPTYSRACYVEGVVTNNTTNANLGSVKVDLLGTNNFSVSNFSGEYYTGAGQPGQYDVRFTRAGCGTQIFTNVALTAGQTVTLNVQMDCESLTDIDDMQLKKPYLTAQPSVFDGQTTLSFYTGENGVSPSTLLVQDLNGRLLHQWNMDTPQGEVHLGENLPAGMYLVTLNNPTFTHSIKILKNR